VFKIRHRGTLRAASRTLDFSNGILVEVQLCSDTEILKDVDDKNKLRFCRNFREFRLWTEKAIDESMFEDLRHKHLTLLLNNKEIFSFRNVYAVGASWACQASKYGVTDVEYRKFVLF